MLVMIPVYYQLSKLVVSLKIENSDLLDGEPDGFTYLPVESMTAFCESSYKSLHEDVNLKLSSNTLPQVNIGNKNISWNRIGDYICTNATEDVDLSASYNGPVPDNADILGIDIYTDVWDRNVSLLESNSTFKSAMGEADKASEGAIYKQSSVYKPPPELERMMNSSMADDIVKEKSDESNKMLIFEMIVSVTNHMIYTGLCIRDYRQGCPVGWLLDEKTCRPEPNTYNGICKPFIANMTNEEKELLSYKCSVEWPCSNMGDPIDITELENRNNGYICPSGWYVVDSLCVASEEIKEFVLDMGCSPLMDFRKYTINMKLQWGEDCKQVWLYDSSNDSKDTYIYTDKDRDIDISADKLDGPVNYSGYVEENVQHS